MRNNCLYAVLQSCTNGDDSSKDTAAESSDVVGEATSTAREPPCRFAAALAVRAAGESAWPGDSTWCLPPC